MFATEVNSLKAISELEREFPYAATLLIYVILERCLKLYLLENRATLREPEVNLECEAGPKKKKKKLSEAVRFDEDTFIKRFLMHCSLGNLECIYNIPDNKYSRFRNKIFHSNLFLQDQRRRDEQSRGTENRKYLKAAKEHLIEASELYFHQKITESNGLLRFEN
jgi:hypothetical protein